MSDQIERNNLAPGTIAHLEKYPPHRLDIGSCCNLAQDLQRALRRHQSMIDRVRDKDSRNRITETFAADVAEIERHLKILDERILAGYPDPVGVPEKIQGPDGRTMNLWSERQATEMQPWYAAYVRAHGGAVPAHRNDLYSAWLGRERSIYFREELGRDLPENGHGANYALAIQGANEGFTAWLKGRYPAMTSQALSEEERMMTDFMSDNTAETSDLRAGEGFDPTSHHRLKWESLVERGFLGMSTLQSGLRHFWPTAKGLATLGRPAKTADQQAFRPGDEVYTAGLSVDPYRVFVDRRTRYTVKGIEVGSARDGGDLLVMEQGVAFPAIMCIKTVEADRILSDPEESERCSVFEFKAPTSTPKMGRLSEKEAESMLANAAIRVMPRSEGPYTVTLTFSPDRDVVETRTVMGTQLEAERVLSELWNTHAASCPGRDWQATLKDGTGKILTTIEDAVDDALEDDEGFEP